MSGQQPQIIYGSIQPSAGVIIKGMFTPQGPHQYIAYSAKSFVYFGKLLNNYFEGDGIYYDFEQFFTYTGAFHDSLKEGFGILSQYKRATYEYRSPDYISSVGDFGSYSTSLQQQIGTQLATWRSRWDSWKSTLAKLESFLEKNAINELRDACHKIKYADIKKTQPSKTTYSYIGELKADARDGLGISFLKNGDIYIGRYVKNKRTGFGLYLWSEENSKHGATHYIGYHNNNAFTKFAAVLLSNGDFYVGQIANNSFTGKGKHVVKCDDSVVYYEGEFKQGKKHGFGKYIDQSCKYEGCFEKDIAHGPGRQELGKCVFQGDFKNGAKSGKGEVKVQGESALETYVGDISEDMLNGVGKLTDKLGNVYEGEFKDNKLNGRCKITYKDGTVCDCNFVEGVRKGEGVVTLPPEKGWTKGESKKLIFECDVATNI